MDIIKFVLVLLISVLVYCNENPVVKDDQCLPVFNIPGVASEPGHSLCQLAPNCTSCCSYNTSCCGFLGCCNGTCCDGVCCDINYGTCQKLASSDNHVCVPNGHNLCGDTICDLNYDCCGPLCAPDGSDCCDSGDTGNQPRFCGPSTLCCGSGCCDDTTPVCCSDYQSCCTTDLPTCCPTTCCDANSYCCADQCCPNGSDHCGDGYYCDAGNHCCGSGSGSWCCNSAIDCCKSGCCTSTSPRCCDNLCWLNGWQPCFDLEAEIDGVPKIPISKYGNWDQQSRCRSTANPNEINHKLLEAFSIQPDTTTIQKARKKDNSYTSAQLNWHKFVSKPEKFESRKVPKQKIKDSPNCLANDATSVDPCFGFPCFMQISDCQSANGYLNYFGEGMLCKKEAESSLFNDQGRIWWNCSQSCITSEIKSTMSTTPLVPCCNSLQEYGLNYVNPKCFVAQCHFCAMYVDNFVALEEIFADNVENVYWQQILNFMDDCKQHTSSPVTEDVKSQR